MADWENLLPIGHRIGPANASVQIIEFSDLECPYCRRFHDTFSKVRTSGLSDISLTFIHFPLSSHRFARLAANASECAADQGRFEEFISTVFANQDSLGLKSFVAFAAAAGVSDTVSFDRCLKSGTEGARVTDGIQQGERLGVRATPTVIINGMRFGNPPGEVELQSFVDSVRAATRVR